MGQKKTRLFLKADNFATVGGRNLYHTRETWLLSSTKARHVKLSDRIRYQKTDDGYQSQGCTMLNFIWTNRVCKWMLLFHCILSENWVKSCIMVKFSVISGALDIMQIRQRICNALMCKLYIFSLDKICFWHMIHVSTINRRKVINFQKRSRFFWSTLYSNNI